MRIIFSTKSLVLLALVFITAQNLFAQSRVLILNATNSLWRYHPNTSDPGYSPADAWVDPAFDDSSWSGPGRGLFGQEAAGVYPFPINSPIPAPGSGGGVSSYFRTHFTWTNEPRGVTLVFTNYVDDGMLVYLNGVELFAYNVPPDRPLAYNVSTLPNGANPGGEPAILRTNVVANLLPGDNVLAVQLQQQATTSSDDVFGMWMHGIIPQAIAITTQPASQTVIQSRPVTFTVGFTGTAPQFQWLKGGVPITDATNQSLTINPVALTDAGSYSVVVSNGVNSVASTAATLQVTPDTAAPRVLGASSVLPTEIGILFDELMDSNTVASPFGYSITGGPGVQSVVVRPDGRSVRLILDGPATSPFTVTLSEARDYVGNIVAANTRVTGTRWADSTDVGAPALVGNAFSPEPGDVEIIAGGNDIWGNGDQMHFVYNLRSGDFDVKVKVQSLNPTDPSAKAGVMARETLDGPSATIWAITMSDIPPGRRIYEPGQRPVEAAATAAWGSSPASGLPNAWIRLRRNGDIFRAYHGTNGTTWTQFAGPTAQVFPTDVFVGLATTSHNVNQTTLASFADYGDVTYPGSTLTITTQPQSITAQQNSNSVTFSAVVTASGAPASEIHYQWQRSPDGTTWTNIPGANSASFALPFPSGEDTADRFRLTASMPGSSVTSSAATLTLTPDTIRPRLLGVAGISPTRVTLFFSEPMDVASADQFAYTIDQGVAVGTATLNAGNPRLIDLDVATLTPGTTYTLTASSTDVGGFITGVQDTSRNPISTFPNASTNTFLAGNYMLDPNAARELPTTGIRPLGSLTDRGFNGRMVQIEPNIANNNTVPEQMLAGEYIDPATGQPYPNLAPLPTFVETNSINYGDAPAGAGTGHLLPDRAFPGYTVAANNMAMEILTYLELRPGIYHMGVNSDDGFRVTPATSVSDPNNAFVIGEFNGGRGVADSDFGFIVTEPGLYPFRLIWEEGQGGAAVEWWIRSQVDGSYLAVNSDAIRAFRPQGGGGGGNPRIVIAPGAGTLTLSWTDADGAYILESSPSLSTPSWSNVSGVTGGGGNFSVTVPSNTGNRFFRLRR